MDPIIEREYNILVNFFDQYMWLEESKNIFEVPRTTEKWYFIVRKFLLSSELRKKLYNLLLAENIEFGSKFFLNAVSFYKCWPLAIPIITDWKDENTTTNIQAEEEEVDLKKIHPYFLKDNYPLIVNLPNWDTLTNSLYKQHHSLNKITKIPLWSCTKRTVYNVKMKLYHEGDISNDFIHFTGIYDHSSTYNYPLWS